MAAKQALDLFVYSLPWTACKGKSTQALTSQLHAQIYFSEVLVKHFAKFGSVVDAHVVYVSCGLSDTRTNISLICMSSVRTGPLDFPRATVSLLWNHLTV